MFDGINNFENTSFSEEDFLETEEKEANERIFIQETKIIEKKKESKKHFFLVLARLSLELQPFEKELIFRKKEQ